MTFPSLWYLGRYSPFESPPPPQFEKHTEPVENKTRLVGFCYLKNVALLAYNLFTLIFFFLVCFCQYRKKKKIESSPQDKAETPPSFNPSPWRPRKKDTSYCECCHQSFSNLEEVEILMVAFVGTQLINFLWFALIIFKIWCACGSWQHLQSDQHRAFVLDPSNYSGVDQLVAEMFPDFDPNPPEQSEKIQWVFIDTLQCYSIFFLMLFVTQQLFSVFDDGFCFVFFPL